MLGSSSASLLANPAGSPSRGRDVAVYVFDINQPSLPTPFYSVLVFISVFMTLLIIYLFMKVSLSPDIILCG